MINDFIKKRLSDCKRNIVRSILIISISWDGGNKSN